MDYSKDLNSKQLSAVKSEYQHNKVIAGAGSGKTRVLTYRIAYLIGEKHILPSKILAITFTNKVAAEMRTRVLKIVPEAEKDLTIKTFHSFAAYFLRKEIDVIGFPSSFTILDEEDQEKMIKDIASQMGFRKSDAIIKKSINYISKNKLKERYPDNLEVGFPPFDGEEDCLEIYTRYEEQKNKMFALDFDDLLLKANYILLNFPDIRKKWQRRIDHILVDEFQDTNDVEYKFIKLLSKLETNLYVVGDPDQTIYTWRGANQDIILHLEKDFPDIHTVIMDRNYRSTQNILESANRLISYNKLRIAKNLYTENNIGEKIITKLCPSLESEANHVAIEINTLVKVKGYKYSDIALLYRSNYITMEFEHAFMTNKIPYIIYGGTKFYQRREIKDVLAYFRILVNPKDDVSFERIINVPKRGIGDTSIATLKKEAIINDLSLFEYCHVINEGNSDLTNKTINSLRVLIKLLDHTKEEIEKDEEVLSKLLEDLLYSIGYNEYLLRDDDSDERIENVKALFANLRNFLREDPSRSFDEFLQNIALLSAQDDVVDQNSVTLMTVHTAKGLEFPVVFVVRLNDTIFPSQRSLAEGFRGLEEERRLAYVAMTRAKERLYLTCAKGYSYVANGNISPSQFFKESGNAISDNLDTNFAGNRSYDNYIGRGKVGPYFDDGESLDYESFEHAPLHKEENKVEINNIVWHVGDSCFHKTFGKGIVKEVAGDGVLTILFFEHGIKSIMGNHKFLSKKEED